MTLDEYQEKALRTAAGLTVQQKILNGILGLNGESGECADILKKHLFQGHPLSSEKLVEEVGDVLWYCSLLASGLGFTLNQVAEINVEKLNRRYPEGFDSKKSIKREESE